MQLNKHKYSDAVSYTVQHLITKDLGILGSYRGILTDLMQICGRFGFLDCIWAQETSFLGLEKSNKGSEHSKHQVKQRVKKKMHKGSVILGSLDITPKREMDYTSKK